MGNADGRRRLSSAILGLGLAVLLSGCAVRSISNPVRGYGYGNATYAGELSDFDVVGAAGALDSGTSGQVTLAEGARVLVVQSGAVFPDERALKALAAHYQVGSASGIPTPGLHGMGMRDAAARGGFDAVLAYWGTLETSERATAGAAASWVPIAGWFVPDREQRMRIRLRVVVLDVGTGRWRGFEPPPMDDARASSIVTRDGADERQVDVLMEAALPAAVEAVVKELGG